MKRLLILLIIAGLGLGLAREVLGIVPGAEPSDLATSFRIVGQTANGVLVVGDEADLGPVSGRVLDQNPGRGLYYTVRPLDDAAEGAVQAIGTVLDFDGAEYLMRLTGDEAGRLRQMRVMIGPVDLDGWVMSDITPAFPSVTANPLIEQMVARVEPDSILSYVRRLQDYGNRYSTGDSCQAAALWIADKFRQFGCDTVILQYYRTGHAPNVIGVKYGSSGQRNPYAIVCGHFDAYAPSNAPGADDNASGTAAAIEACRAMQDYVFTSDLKYIAWSGEEFGLYGSEHYADLARQQGDSILAVLNADMIGYVDAAPEDCNLMAKVANPPCEPLADFFIAVADTYTTLPCVKEMMSNNQNSDHGPFWNNGYVALTAIEDFWPVNPHYHTSHDSIGAGYNSNEFCTEVTKAQVAALATLGQPVPLNQPLLGQVRARFDDSGGNGDGRWDPGETVDVFVLLKNFGMVDAHGVSARLSSPDTFATVLQDSAWYGDVISQDTVENTTAYSVRAAVNTPREHVIGFELTIASEESTWLSTFGLRVGEYFVTDPIPDGPRTPALYWAYDDVDTGYAETPEYEWIEINSTGTQISFQHNDDVVGVDLPAEFGTFRFYGQGYTRLSVSADGWICPGVYTQRHYTNRGLPDGQNPPGLLCPNWDDLYPSYNGQGHVYYEHDSADHRFIIEYDSVAYYNPRDTRDKYEVVIYDSTMAAPSGDNVVVMQYMTANRFGSSTVGIQDPTRAIAIQVVLNGDWTRGASPIEPG
ncbi:MAG: M28 family peptidase, partial [candidate division WOR-3 bacterium]